MERYQQEFAEFAVRTGALRFGAFTLKSGRRSPYFFNSGAFDRGPAIARLGLFYARAALTLGDPPDVVYGPAYKGIPLAVSTAVAFHQELNADVAYCFDRKEAKAHGDQGLFVGHVPQKGERVLLVDDVITDGATKLEAIRQLRAATEAELCGLVIAFNRQERTADGADPIALLERTAGLPVRAVVNVRDVMAYLRCRPIDGEVVLDDTRYAEMESYLSEYGLTS